MNVAWQQHGLYNFSHTERASREQLFSLKTVGRLP